MRHGILSLVVCLMSATMVPAFAHAQGGYYYPKIMTPGGRYYGPTVAAGEYQRRYGQPWHGYGGLYSPVAPQSYNIRLYPTFVPYGGYGCYGDGVAPPGYVGNYYLPPPGYFDSWMSPRCMANRGSCILRPEYPADRRGASNWDDVPRLASPPYKPEFTSAEMQAVSERRLHHGDLWLKKRDYENARQSYATAIDVAPDTPLPHFRMGMVLSVLGRFPDAVAEFKKGLEFDPTWPATGESLNDLFGAANRADISSMENRAADWVQRDIRDPDRLFLMGVLLHFDKHSQAGVFFETAMKLSGSGSHLEAFLQPPPPDGLAAVSPKDVPAPPQPAGSPASDASAAGSKAPSTNRSPAFVPPLPAPENEPDQPPEGTVPNMPPVKQPEEQGQDSGPVLLSPNS